MISTATGGTVVNYSDRFSLSGMTGVFPANVQAGLKTVTGTSGPKTENNVDKNAAANPAGPTLGVVGPLLPCVPVGVLRRQDAVVDSVLTCSGGACFSRAVGSCAHGSDEEAPFMRWGRGERGSEPDGCGIGVFC